MPFFGHADWNLSKASENPEAQSPCAFFDRLDIEAANSAGSLVPSPAGIGPVEVALTSGLTLAGIPSTTALSVVIVFRVLTLWARVPLGWLALRSLQRSNDL